MRKTLLSVCSLFLMISISAQEIVWEKSMHIYNKVKNEHYYNEVLNEILESTIKENPKDKYYFESPKSIYNSSDGLFDIFIDCENNFSSFKQLEKNQDINISEKYKHHILKKSFLNKIILGRRLKKIEIDNLFYNKDTNTYLLKVSFQEKEGEKNVLVFFDDSEEKILDTCYSFSIY
jgi:hypothetical protein